MKSYTIKVAGKWSYRARIGFWFLRYGLRLMCPWRFGAELYIDWEDTRKDAAGLAIVTHDTSGLGD